MIEDLSGYVDRYYEIIPECETVLFDGTFLRNGMIVLAEDPSQRLDIPGDSASRAEIYHARTHNRWCVVRDVMQLRYPDGYRTISFVGEYADGSMRKRALKIHHAWIVKKDSIPAKGSSGLEKALESMKNLNSAREV